MPDSVATCKCGKVEFQLTGEPLITPNCCCNDCVIAAHFVDEKAKAAGVENISGMVEGNPQSATMCLWPASGIKLVKGGELIKGYKLRPSSKTQRCYTSCCCTTVVAVTGDQLPTAGLGFPFNR